MTIFYLSRKTGYGINIIIATAKRNFFLFHLNFPNELQTRHWNRLRQNNWCEADRFTTQSNEYVVEWLGVDIFFSLSVS